MKQIIILSLFTLLTSCGKNSFSELKDEQIINTENIQVELSVKEIELKNYLLDIGEIKQQELTTELLAFNGLNMTTLKNLDQFINVKCVKSSELCYITVKE